MQAEARARDTGGRDTALEADYTAWLRTYYPKAVSRPMASYHHEFWRWLWLLERDKRHPEHDAFFGIWSRGCGKTTSGVLSIAVLGALKKRRYGWLLSRTQAQANQKLLTLRSAISKIGTGFLTAYPHMGQAKTEDGHSLGWNTQRLVCGTGDARFVMESIGLDMAVRGANVEFVRPDFIMPDDVDALHDSPYMVEKNIQTLTHSVIPAGSNELAVLGLQNLIHQDSIFAQIADGRAKFLRNRKISGDGPIPAFQGEFKAEERETVKGPRYFITSGAPTWPEGFGVVEAEKEINETGLDAFLAECQHEVTGVHEDATFREFDPVYHCITVSEFMRFFIGNRAHGINYQPLRADDCKDNDGRFRLTLPRGESAMAQDWGNNPKHPCGTRWMWRAGEYQPLTDSVFFIREMCWPAFPPVNGDTRANPSYGQLHKAILQVERELSISEMADGARIAFRLVSHERPEAAQAYAKDFDRPLNFRGINTSQAREGILHLQEFHHINRGEYHPFRVDPRSTVPLHDCVICGWRHTGGHLQGRPRAFYLVADGQGELYEDNGKLKARPAIDEMGQARTRWEYPRHRPKHSTEGEEKEAPKRDDEMVDTDRALAGFIYALIKRLPDEQRIKFMIEDALPAHLQHLAVANITDPDAQSIAQQARYQQQCMLKAGMKQKEYEGHGLSVYEQMLRG